MRKALLIVCSLIVLPFSARAVTVNIFVNVYPTCNYPSGQIQAMGNGGVGPYTYLWNTGATTEQLNAIPTGDYSVTITDANSDQASANITLTGQPYALIDLGDSGPQGLCAIGVTGVVVDVPGYSQLSGAYMGDLPYTIDGQLMQEFISYEFGNPLDTLYTWTGFPAQYGTSVIYSFADGAGCTGTLTEYIGYPVEWPTLSVLDIQGACSGGNNGTVTFQTGLEGHGQYTQVKLTDLNGSYLNSVTAGDQIYTNTFTLSPGDYLLTQFMSESGFLVSSGCQLSTPITIPDLGSACGNIGGYVFMDNNENCTRQGNEPGVLEVVLEILPGPVYALTNGGQYGVNLPRGSYTIEQQSAMLEDHCVSAPIPFTLAVGNAFQTVDIADTALVPMDAAVSIATGPARPGFSMNCTALMRNLTLANTGASTITVEFDPLLSYLSANPVPTTINGNTLTWNIAALSSFQQRGVNIQLQVPPDITLLGTELLFTASITTANTDAVAANNTTTTTTTVTGSYDPNDKTATTSSRSSSEAYFLDLDEWIDYTIRFQNTGTDTAFNVVITDTIPQELDLGSFVAGAASHAHSLSIRDGNVLRWAFYNIQLPDSNVNEPGSHGFVSFRIKPQEALMPGNQIENIANIYFDYNPPVITEPSVLVAELSTSIGQPSVGSKRQLSVYPNPTTDGIDVLSEGAAIHRVSVMALDGREILNRTLTGTRARIELDDVAAGSYVLLVHRSDGTTDRTVLVKQNP